MLRNLQEKVRLLLGRKRAYRRVFMPNGELSPDAKLVMADLAQFCHVGRSTFRVSPVTKQADSHAMALAEGRREVFLRLHQTLNFDESSVLDMTEEATR